MLVLPLLDWAVMLVAVALQRPASPLLDDVPPHAPGAYADMLPSEAYTYVPLPRSSKQDERCEPPPALAVNVDALHH